MTRPRASVVVPFRGDESQAERLAESLAGLELGADDELIVVDNSDAGWFGGPEGGCYLPGGSGPRRVFRATGERSSYYARNAGAAVARSEWLVFIDADCVPAPSLLDAYFAEPVAGDVGALAGAVVADPGQRHFLARYATDRGFLDQESGVHTAKEAAATANLAVRREAFQAIGAFEEGIRSGGDVDLCRRLMATGWRIERRAKAVVTHLHRESLPDLMGAIARYASGARWLNERYPGTAPQWPVVPGLVGASRDIAANAVRLRFEEAAFRGVDSLGLIAHAIGYRRSNDPN